MIGDVVFVRLDVNDHHVGGPVFLNFRDERTDVGPVWQVHLHVPVDVERGVVWISIQPGVVKETRMRNEEQGHAEEGEDGQQRESSDGPNRAGALPFATKARGGLQHGVNRGLRVEILDRTADF